ncbi:hypothetical protein J2T57_001248 [Natronocella acetinitrilica]|uniref:Uncharacterized protein n=1 Tax=Natronocella acetinitrilica TaxID=414046 RepID=A0AAE3G1T4_9GAMM|nr:hypothetical protein [Natronocella acetinitrilica]MCP1674146.1 hypothetical protein [Natronocella acetinitrilica]
MTTAIVFAFGAFLLYRLVSAFRALIALDRALAEAKGWEAVEAELRYARVESVSLLRLVLRRRVETDFYAYFKRDGRAFGIDRLSLHARPNVAARNFLRSLEGARSVVVHVDPGRPHVGCALAPGAHSLRGEYLRVAGLLLVFAGYLLVLPGVLAW